MFEKIVMAIDGPAADEHEADAIVIGSSGHGLMSELLLGSVAHQVLKQAHCPVVVAR